MASRPTSLQIMPRHPEARCLRHGRLEICCEGRCPRHGRLEVRLSGSMWRRPETSDGILYTGTKLETTQTADAAKRLPHTTAPVPDATGLSAKPEAPEARCLMHPRRANLWHGTQRKTAKKRILR